MLLTCPACSSSYRVAPGSLGGGRTVRCARCRVEWFAQDRRPNDDGSPPVEAALVDAEDDVIDAFEPERDRPTEIGVELEAAKPSQTGALSHAIPGRHARPDAARSLTEPSLSRAPGRPVPSRHARSRLPAKARPIALCAAFGCALVASAIVARAEVVRRAPSLASFYELAGLHVNVRGLTISDLKSVEQIDDGVPILLVTGQIANVAKAQVEVPRLRLAVKAGDDRELYSWTTVIGRSSLAPGESASFRARLASPPAEGRAIDVRFLTRHDLQSHLR